MKTNTLGSYQWGIKSGGSLNSRDKINIMLQVLSMKFIRTKKNNKTPKTLDVTEIRLPDSKLVLQTLEYINDVHKTPIRNHCLRVFLLGEYFGRVEKLKFDRELYAISAMLHDLGLEEGFCGLHKGIDCFAIEGAKAAGRFLQQHELMDQKIRVVEDAIALHLNIKVRRAFTEAYLLNKASATDTIGLYRDQISDVTAREIGDKYPRNRFNEDLHKILKYQCRMRPQSRIAFLYANGFGTMLKANKFDMGKGFK